MHTTRLQHITDILHRPTYPLAAREEIHCPRGYIGGARHRIAALLSLWRLEPHHPPMVQQNIGYPPNMVRLPRHIPFKHHRVGHCRPLRMEHAATRRHLGGRTTILRQDNGPEARVEGVDLGVVGQRNLSVPDMGVGFLRGRDRGWAGAEVLGGDGYEGA